MNSLEREEAIRSSLDISLHGGVNGLIGNQAEPSNPLAINGGSQAGVALMILCLHCAPKCCLGVQHVCRAVLSCTDGVFCIVCTQNCCCHLQITCERTESIVNLAVAGGRRSLDRLVGSAPPRVVQELARSVSNTTAEARQLMQRMSSRLTGLLSGYRSVSLHSDDVDRHEFGEHLKRLLNIF